jgi:hypothetical protein
LKLKVESPPTPPPHLVSGVKKATGSATILKRLGLLGAFCANNWVQKQKERKKSMIFVCI